MIWHILFCKRGLKFLFSQDAMIVETTIYTYDIALDAGRLLLLLE